MHIDSCVKTKSICSKQTTGIHSVTHISDIRFPVLADILYLVFFPVQHSYHFNLFCFVQVYRTCSMKTAIGLYILFMHAEITFNVISQMYSMLLSRYLRDIFSLSTNDCDPFGRHNNHKVHTYIKMV